MSQFLKPGLEYIGVDYVSVVGEGECVALP